MKIKFLLFTLIISIHSLFASHDSVIASYILVAQPELEIMDEKFIDIYKVPFITHYSNADLSVQALTWSYKLNAAHSTKVYQGIEGNFAHSIGLKISVDYAKNKSCTVTIDSRNIIQNYSKRELDKILSYAKKATKLNMKESKLNCEIKSLRKEVHFSPKPLNVEKTIARKFHAYKSSYFVYDTFYPLGFSNDGKIAYIIEHDNDPADMVYIETIVQDLVTDKILWRDEFKTEENIQNVNFKTFWKSKESTIEKRLKSYGIEPFENTKVEGDSIRYDGYGFIVYSENSSYFVKDWNSNFLKNSAIYIDSKSKGRKRIDFKTYKDSHLLDRKPIGFLSLGKNSKRTAVLVVNVTRGWEGPPHNIGYEVVGANLGVGFKR